MRWSPCPTLTGEPGTKGGIFKTCIFKDNKYLHLDCYLPTVEWNLFSNSFLLSLFIKHQVYSGYLVLGLEILLVKAYILKRVLLDCKELLGQEAGRQRQDKSHVPSFTRHTLAWTHICTHILIHTRTHTQVQTNAHIYAHTQTHTWTHACPHSHANWCSSLILPSLTESLLLPPLDLKIKFQGEGGLSKLTLLLMERLRFQLRKSISREPALCAACK